MKTIKFAAVLVALTFSAGVFATTPQQALEDASRYTVQIFKFASVGLNADSGVSSRATGFLIDQKRGWILTNAHVASRSPVKLEVEFKGSDTLDAKRVFVDHYLDMAVIAVDPNLLPKNARVATLNCDTTPGIGTPVAIFGNPSDFRFVASRGIISGIPWLSQKEHVQSDAAINSGNSGGPLIDLETGKVIGIAAESYKDDDDNATVVALSVPMPSVCTILNLLKSNGDATMRMLPAAIATQPRDERPIVAMTETSNSQLLPGDLIVSVEGGPALRNPADLYDQLRGKSSVVKLQVERAGQAMRVETPVKIMPSLLASKSLDLSGLVISEPWRLDHKYNVDKGRLVIDFIIPDTPAENLDLALGAVIVSVDGMTFDTVAALHAYISSKPKGSEVQIVVQGSSDDSRFHSSFSVVKLSADDLKWIYVEK